MAQTDVDSRDVIPNEGSDIKQKAFSNANKAHASTNHEGRNEAYDQWADQYDNELSIEQYQGPYYVAEHMANHLNGQLNSRIIDIAAGTGHVASHLRVWGYQNCDALDASQGMLDKAKLKDLYVNYICALLGDNKDIADDTYDGACMAGAFGPGHIPCQCVPEMIRMVKPGGVICMGIRTEFLDTVEEYRNRLVPMFEELEDNGSWRLLEKITVNDWFVSFPGVVWVYQVTCSGYKETVLKSLKC